MQLLNNKRNEIVEENVKKKEPEYCIHIHMAKKEAAHIQNDIFQMGMNEDKQDIRSIQQSGGAAIQQND